ncbi:MAG: hypothetical protein RLY11_1410 [Bacteroidota bacterium]|jgi:hypothetical protein
MSKGMAQENSPYSRYGLGDLTPSQNNLNRAMGGLSAAYSNIQSVNFTNPASYAFLKITSYDIGLDYSSRTLRTINPPKSFTSSYLIPSYFQLGLPLSKKNNWGMNIGLRPISRINYDIAIRTRTPIDSVRYGYVGNGGSYQAYTGMGFGTKNFTVGFNVGYMFGNKEYNTRVSFVSDTITYKMSNSTDTTRFGGIFYNAGFQYKFNISKTTSVKLGAFSNFKTELSAIRNISRETINFSTTNGVQTIDSVYHGTDEKGTIIYPASWGAGFSIDRENSWMIGAEFNKAKWNDYRYYGKTDFMSNTWTMRLGGQFVPNYKGEGYWSKVAYRLGFSFGPENIKLNNTVRQKTFSFGTGLPVRRNVYTNQYTVINTAFELSYRGNKTNDLKESIFRISLGLNLGDIWFNKPKYQ